MSHRYYCKLGRYFTTIMLFWIIGTMAGCAYAPVQEMSDARQAIQAARSAGAEIAAPDKLREAEELLGQAVMDLEEGVFDGAKERAKAAWNAAIEARKATEQIKQIR